MGDNGGPPERDSFLGKGKLDWWRIVVLIVVLIFLALIWYTIIVLFIIPLIQVEAWS